MVDITALLKAAVASTDDTKAVMNFPGGVSVNVYASPLTPNDLKIVGRKHPNFMLQPTMEGMVDLLVQKAKGDDGAKLFTLEHKPDLMRLSSTVITGLFGDLFGEQMTFDDEEGQEARKGKSKATG